MLLITPRYLRGNNCNLAEIYRRDNEKSTKGVVKKTRRAFHKLFVARPTRFVCEPTGALAGAHMKQWNKPKPLVLEGWQTRSR